jgi:hypothetical protein
MNSTQSLEPHQQRMIDEFSELSQRLTNLRRFFDTPHFKDLPEAERVRMKAQELFMAGYEDILSQRIAAI